jgi:hypothetical protein
MEDGWEVLFGMAKLLDPKRLALRGSNLGFGSDMILVALTLPISISRSSNPVKENVCDSVDMRHFLS